MDYNWTSADTPQGRARLKELMDGGMEVVCYSPEARYGDLCFANLDENQICHVGDYFYHTFDAFMDESESLKFLDPQPKEVLKVAISAQ